MTKTKAGLAYFLLLLAFSLVISLFMSVFTLDFAFSKSLVSTAAPAASDVQAGTTKSAVTVAKKEKQIPLLTEILNQYRESNALELKTSRTIKSELLNQEQKQEGILYLAGAKIRWEFSKPEKSILIFDGRTFWNVQAPPEEFGGPTQVMKTKLNKNSRGQIVLTSVLGKEPLSKFFKFVETKQNSSDELEYFLVPLKKDQMGAKEVRISISKAKRLVTRVTYFDDVGNATIVDMKKTEFKTEVKSSLFVYKPGPKDRVSEL